MEFGFCRFFQSEKEILLASSYVISYASYIKNIAMDITIQTIPVIIFIILTKFKNECLAKNDFCKEI